VLLCVCDYHLLDRYGTTNGRRSWRPQGAGLCAERNVCNSLSAQRGHLRVRVRTRLRLLQRYGHDAFVFYTFLSQTFAQECQRKTVHPCKRAGDAFNRNLGLNDDVVVQELLSQYSPDPIIGDGFLPAPQQPALPIARAIQEATLATIEGLSAEENHGL
jgi:hypothetical protein